MRAFDKTGWEWTEVRTTSVRVQPGRLAGLQVAVPFLIAGLLWLWGKVVFGAIVAALGLVILLLKIVAPPAYEALLALLATLGKWLGKTVSYVSLTLVYGLLFTPVAYIARLLRRDGLELAWQSSKKTYWVDTSGTDPTRVFAKPFLVERSQSETTPRSGKIIRLGKVLYHTAVTLFVLNLALGYLAVKVREGRSTDRVIARSQLAVYAGESWARDYWKEFSQTRVRIYKPFVGWGRDEYAGHYINVEEGHRKTYRPSGSSQPTARVYTFGASAMWGTGARDEYTIPSYLAKLAAQEGLPLAVENYAEQGFVNWQSILRLAGLCAEGKVPDLVVFYEGAADVGAKLETPDVRRGHMNFSEVQERFEQPDDPRRWLEKNSLVHMIAKKVGHRFQARRAQSTVMSNEPKRVQRLANEVVSTYEENSAFVSKLAAAYGFKVWFFWQPVVYTKKHPTPVERTYRRSSFGQLMPDVYHAATQEIRARDFAIDLSASFDEQERTVYIDWAHVIEPANEIVAKRIYGHLRPTLRALGSGQASNGAKR